MSNLQTTTLTTLTTQITLALNSAVHGREAARELGAKLLGLFEACVAAEVARHGEEAIVPRIALVALERGNLYLSA